MKTEVIDRLYREWPMFHGGQNGLTNWSSQREVLEFISNHLAAGDSSMETGCGYSTVMFASLGIDHTVITPQVDEMERVRSFCKRWGVDDERLRFEIGKSHEVLPNLREKSQINLMYIDGAHAFPHPCLDWMYTEKRLAIGGYMLIDDIRIPTCRILHDFLICEDNWTLDRYIGDTAVFKKVADGRQGQDWLDQKYNRRFPDYSFLPLNVRAYKKLRSIVGVVARRLRVRR